jgi:hypothetical protein
MLEGCVRAEVLATTVGAAIRERRILVLLLLLTLKLMSGEVRARH